MRIAILTFHRAFNCGAMLQAWALKTVLERMGHSVEFPECNRIGESERWLYKMPGQRLRLSGLRDLLACLVVNGLSIGNEDLSRHRFRRFRRKYLPSGASDIEAFVGHYDLVVVGSDQVWSPEIVGDQTPLFLGQGIDKALPMISYAASVGDAKMSDSQLRRLAEFLPRFSAISVREPLARNQIAPYVDKDIQVVVDPTLLLDADDYREIAVQPDFREPYLYVYAIQATKFVVESARAVAKQLGLKTVITPIGQYSRFHAPKGLTYGVSPERMVGYIRKASFVMTSSFHGTALALVHSKPFLSLREKIDDFESRPAAILNRLGLSGRLVCPEVTPTKMVERLTSEVPRTAYEELHRFKRESLDWLNAAINRGFPT